MRAAASPRPVQRERVDDRPGAGVADGSRRSRAAPSRYARAPTPQYGRPQPDRTETAAGSSGAASAAASAYPRPAATGRSPGPRPASPGPSRPRPPTRTGTTATGPSRRSEPSPPTVPPPANPGSTPRPAPPRPRRRRRAGTAPTVARLHHTHPPTAPPSARDHPPIRPACRPLVVRGAGARRPCFPIPLSIRACGFPAHGLPMVFLTWLRSLRIADGARGAGSSPWPLNQSSVHCAA